MIGTVDLISNEFAAFSDMDKWNHPLCFGSPNFANRQLARLDVGVSEAIFYEKSQTVGGTVDQLLLDIY